MPEQAPYATCLHVATDWGEGLGYRHSSLRSCVFTVFRQLQQQMQQKSKVSVLEAIARTYQSSTTIYAKSKASRTYVRVSKGWSCCSYFLFCSCPLLACLKETISLASARANKSLYCRPIVSTARSSP